MLSLLTGIPVEDFEKEEVKNSYLGEEWNRYLGFVQGENHFEKITVRQALQWIGTDLFRDKFHTNTWVNALFADYKISLSKGEIVNITDKTQMVKYKGMPKVDYPNWIISDVRFPNEIKAIKDRGGIVIRVDRPLYEYSFIEKCEAHPKDDIHQWISKSGSGNFVSFNANVWTKETSLKKLMEEHYTEFPEHESETALDDYENFDYIIENDSDLISLMVKVKKMLEHFNLIDNAKTT